MLRKTTEAAKTFTLRSSLQHFFFGREPNTQQTAVKMDLTTHIHSSYIQMRPITFKHRRRYGGATPAMGLHRRMQSVETLVQLSFG